MPENPDIHVLPANDLMEHTESRNCWCCPRLEWPCDECVTGCWKCGGKMLPEPTGHACVVTHNALDGRKD